MQLHQNVPQTYQSTKAKSMNEHHLDQGCEIRYIDSFMQAKIFLSPSLSTLGMDGKLVQAKMEDPSPEPK